MNYNQWSEKYKPKHFEERHQGGHPYLLETFGKDLEIVENSKQDHIWTLIDGDDGNLYIVNGFHHVNRVNYIITEEPFEGDFLEVLDD